MLKLIIALAVLGRISMTGGDQWYVPLREGCQEASTRGLSPKEAMATASRDGYEYQVTDSGGSHPDVVMIKSHHPLFRSMGGGMLFARTLAVCERLRGFGAARDALHE